MRVFRTEIRLIQISVAVSVIIAGVALFLLDPGEPWFSAQDSVQTPAPEESEPVLPKIVCLGDSYTFGYPYKQEASWPHFMAQTLAMEVANEGKQQQTAADLLARFDEDVVNKYRPHTVIILSGMGDALSSMPPSLEAYQENILALVKKAQENNIKPILIMPFSCPEEAAQNFIKQYREWLAGYAESGEAVVVDVQGMLCDGETGIKKQYSDNAKYPNEEGYKEIGVFIAEQIKDKLP